MYGRFWIFNKFTDSVVVSANKDNGNEYFLETIYEYLRFS